MCGSVLYIGTEKRRNYYRSIVPSSRCYFHGDIRILVDIGSPIKRRTSNFTPRFTTIRNVVFYSVPHLWKHISLGILTDVVLCVCRMCVVSNTFSTGGVFWMANRGCKGRHPNYHNGHTSRFSCILSGSNCSSFQLKQFVSHHPELLN